MLSSTVALVTGGASGLGAAAVRNVVQNGGRAVIADLAAQEGLALELISSLGADKVAFSPTDVTDESSVSAALDLATSKFSTPNAVVSCAGVATPGKTVGKKGPLPLARFQNVLEVNTVGTFNVIRLAAERMATLEPNKDGLRGCLVNTASIAAYEGQVGQAAYAASKGAIVGLTLPVARDLAPLGIRCVTVAPGLFATPLLAGLPQQVQDEMGKQIPCPSKLGDPADFGKLIGSIIDNDMINGEVIRLDGAYRMPPV